MGNRGVLHNARQEIVRDWQVRRWIACRLEFRGRHRQVMTPGSYTELFFLDEAAALADGHRPCAECRHADYLAFQNSWSAAFPQGPLPTADSMDAVVHAERRVRPYVKRTHQMELSTLPDATYVSLNGQACLVLGNTLLEWSAGGYGQRRPRPVHGNIEVLTPPSIVEVLRKGFRPVLHPTSHDFNRWSAYV